MPTNIVGVTDRSHNEAEVFKMDDNGGMHEQFIRKFMWFSNILPF